MTDDGIIYGVHLTEGLPGKEKLDQSGGIGKRVIIRFVLPEADFGLLIFKCEDLLPKRHKKITAIANFL